MFKKLRWLLIGLLFIGGGISYLDRAALSIAAPLLSRDLNLEPGQLGLVFSIFFFGYAAFCFVGGWASDRIGPKNVFTLAMTVWSVFCGLTAAVVGLWYLLFVRIVFGMGEGPFSATANKFVSNWFPPRRASQRGWNGQCRAAFGRCVGWAAGGLHRGRIQLAGGFRCGRLARDHVGHRLAPVGH